MKKRIAPTTALNKLLKDIESVSDEKLQDACNNSFTQSPESTARLLAKLEHAYGMTGNDSFKLVYQGKTCEAPTGSFEEVFNESLAEVEPGREVVVILRYKKGRPQKKKKK